MLTILKKVGPSLFDPYDIEISFPEKTGLQVNSVDPTIILLHKPSGIKVTAKEISQYKSLQKCYELLRIALAAIQ